MPETVPSRGRVERESVEHGLESKKARVVNLQNSSWKTRLETTSTQQSLKTFYSTKPQDLLHTKPSIPTSRCQFN